MPSESDPQLQSSVVSPPWSRTIPFRVDVAGIIHIMGTALYSRPQAALRELIQNAHDAIVRRQQIDLSYRGRIDIGQCAETGVLTISDDGIGLSPDEAERFLGTLGVGMTGLLKGEHPDAIVARSDVGLIGQFGIGLFSAFMIADHITVESRRIDSDEAVRWSAGPGTDIELSSCDRSDPGTKVTLRLRPECRSWTSDGPSLERAIRQYADYLPIPIYLNQANARTNVIHSAWFDPTPDAESLEMEIAAHFDETPLDVIPIHVGGDVPISGALYVTPQRTPGFSGTSVVTATVLRMVISPHIQELLPEWATFVRGVLELPKCRPTASREELVRDHAFIRARNSIEEQLFQHFEELARSAPTRFESVLTWHRYMWAGNALTHPRLRKLLASTYRFNTSQGLLSADEIISRSRADALVESDFEYVVWYNTDRRQEQWINSLFSDQTVPCVHTLRSFEESLLATFVSDEARSIDLRYTTAGSPGFAAAILGMREMDEAPTRWSEFLGFSDAKIYCADFREDIPVMAFLNEQTELVRTFEELKKQGTVPSAFQRLIDRHFDDANKPTNEVLLNRRHRLVGRALEQKTSSPLASVLRLLVGQALTAAGATIPTASQRLQAEDLDWIADALWGRTGRSDGAE